jgi:hypothetical protein
VLGIDSSFSLSCVVDFVVVVIEDVRTTDRFSSYRRRRFVGLVCRSGGARDRCMGLPDLNERGRRIMLVYGLTSAPITPPENQSWGCAAQGIATYHILYRNNHSIVIQHWERIIAM